MAWLDDEPLVAGRAYWALHGHRWVKARVQRIVHRLDVNTLAEDSHATQIDPNGIGHVELTLQEPVAALPFAQSRALGCDGAGGHGQPQNLGRRAGQLMQIKRAHGRTGGWVTRLPIKSRVFTEDLPQPGGLPSFSLKSFST